MNRHRLRRYALRAAAAASVGLGLLVVTGGVAQADDVSSPADVTVGQVVVADTPSDAPVDTAMIITWN